MEAYPNRPERENTEQLFDTAFYEVTPTSTRVMTEQEVLAEYQQLVDMGLEHWADAFYESWVAVKRAESGA